MTLHSYDTEPKEGTLMQIRNLLTLFFASKGSSYMAVMLGLTDSVDGFPFSATPSI